MENFDGFCSNPRLGQTNGIIFTNPATCVRLYLVPRIFNCNAKDVTKERENGLIANSGKIRYLPGRR